MKNDNNNLVVVIYPSTHYAQIIARDIFDGKVQYLAVPPVIISPPMSRDDASAALQLLAENGIVSAMPFLKDIFDQPLSIERAAMFSTQFKARANGLEYTLVGIWGNRALMSQSETATLIAPPLALVIDTMLPCNS